MCHGPLCPHANYNKNKSLPPQCKDQCTPPEKYSQKQKDYLIEKCKQSEASVIKVVRISELADLMPFYTNSEYDLRVIMLVRKPTAMMDSRRRLWNQWRKLGWGDYNDNKFKTIKYDCDRSVKSKLTFDRNELVRRKTLIIR